MIRSRCPLTAASVFLAAAISACATTPISSAEATDVPESRLQPAYYDVAATGAISVTVKRDEGFLMGGGSGMTLLINGSRVAILYPGEKVTVRVNPGSYLFGTVPTNNPFGLTPKETSVQVGDQNPKTLRIFIDASGTFGVAPTSF